MELEQELLARRPIWVALSELFLDTDVRASYPYVARTLAESPYSMEELRRILDDEVTPVLQSNLAAVAGEGAGFEKNRLAREMAERLGKPRDAPLLVNMDREWDAVAKLAEVLRGIPEADARLRRSQAWSLLLPLFCTRRVRVNHLSADFSMRDLESFFRQELWPVLIDDARKLARSEPEIFPDEIEIESNWRNLVAAILP